MSILRRSIDIDRAKGAKPGSVTARDKAYILDFYTRFGDSKFKLSQIKDRELKQSIAGRFKVKSARLDDRTVLGKRLPEHGLLENSASFLGQLNFQLTEKGLKLAKELSHDNSAALS